MKGEKKNEEKHTQTLYGFCNDSRYVVQLTGNISCKCAPADPALKPLLSTI